MSVVTIDQFDRTLTQSEVDAQVNRLFVDELSFSHISGLFHRWYGVITGAADGERIFTTDPNVPNRSEQKDRFVISPCVRYAFSRLSSGIQASLEAELGWHVTPKYVVEEVPFPRLQEGAFQTAFPGVEKMNVRLSWHTIDGLQDVEYSPFVEVECPVVSTGGADYSVKIDDRLFGNPADAWIRMDSNNAVFPWFYDDSHPLRRDRINHYWELPLDVSKRTYTTGMLLNAQHKRIVQVFIEPPDLPVGATLYPVYPGTNQIIPEIKEMSRITKDGLIQFTFYVYSLIHPDFEAETVDLTAAGEFYKLYPSIEFRYCIEEEALPEIIVTRADVTETITDPVFTLTNSEHGIFHVNYDQCQTYAWQCLCRDWPVTTRIRYYYKTNPSYLPSKLQEFKTRLREAVSGRIAAELPTYACNCPIDWGYIANKQQGFGDSFTTIATNGAQLKVDKVRYGQLLGQIEYAEALNDAPKYKRPLFVQ